MSSSWSEDTKEAIVVWSLVACSFATITAITYFTYKDLMKFNHDYLSVLKDPFTAFFVTFSFLSLLLKMTIIDTYFKNEVDTTRSCALFVSDYLPQFFIALSSALVSIKLIMLVIINKDTLESYKKNQSKRLKIAAWILAPIYLFLFIMMNLRFTTTCYRTFLGKTIDELFSIRTKNHFTIQFTVQLASIIALIVSFIMLR